MVNDVYCNILERIQKENKENKIFEESKPFMCDSFDVAVMVNLIQKTQMLYFLVPVGTKKVLFGVFYSPEETKTPYLLMRCDSENDKFKSYSTDEEEIIKFLLIQRDYIKENFSVFGIKDEGKICEKNKK